MLDFVSTEGYSVLRASALESIVKQQQQQQQTSNDTESDWVYKS